MLLRRRLQPLENIRLPPRIPLRVGSQPFLVFGGAVLTALPVPYQVDLSESSAAQLLDHPVLAAEFGQGTWGQV